MSTAAERARWEMLPDGGLRYYSRINMHAYLRREAIRLGHRLRRFAPLPISRDPDARWQSPRVSRAHQGQQSLLSTISCQRCGRGAVSNLTSKTLYPGELLSVPCT